MDGGQTKDRHRWAGGVDDCELRVDAAVDAVLAWRQKSLGEERFGGKERQIFGRFPAKSFFKPIFAGAPNLIFNLLVIACLLLVPVLVAWFALW
jgi:hypothetical protein